MKILKLNTSETSTVTAIVPNRKKQDRLFYEIQHGSKGKELWMWTANLAYQQFIPSDSLDTLELTKDNYFLKTLYKDGEPTSDKAGNVNYLITTDNMNNHKRDILLLWEIPNINNVTDLKYNAEGMVSELGLGFTGRERGSVSGKTPAPILEIIGDCVLSWSCEADGIKSSQTIKYDHLQNSWDIQPISRIPISKLEANKEVGCV